MKQLTQRQKAIIIGSILGDGYLDFSGFNGTRLQVKQSEKYKDYIFWLHNEFSNLCKSKPNQKQDNYQWYFGTRYSKELTKLREKFYLSRRKIIPDDIGTMLHDPLSLAVWYMDDGTLDYRPKDHYAFSISTNCFTVKQVELLKGALEKNFGITTSIQNLLCRGKRYPRLYIGKFGRDKFLKIIKPNILKCFSHKLPPL